MTSTCIPNRVRLVWHLRRLELIAKYADELSVPTINLFCVVYKDVDNLYKWQPFQPKSLHQSQVSHAGNNTTIIRDINRVYIYINRVYIDKAPPIINNKTN